MKTNRMFRGRMRLVASALSLGCAMFLSTGQTVLAQPNSAQFQDCSFVFPADPGVLCDFAVNVAVTCVGKTTVLPGNRTHQIFPGEQALVTNVANGNSVTLNIPGSFHVTTFPNGTVVTKVTGRNLLSDPLAGFVLALGNFSFAFDAAGNLVQPLKGKGQLVDVCALIQ